MNKLEQAYLDGFVKAANALSTAIEGGIKHPSETAEAAIGRLQAQKSRDFIMPKRTNFMGQPLRGGPAAAQDVTSGNIWRNPGSNTIGDMSLRKATGLGLGLGGAAAVGGQAAGALTSNIGTESSNLNQRVQAAAKGPGIDPSGLYEMLKQHLSNHKMGYGVGAGALGLGGLGYYLSKHKNKQKLQDEQIPFSSGEDEPGVESNE